jgi:hypothetical protein
VLAVATVLAVMIYTERMVSDLRDSSRRFLSLKVERFKMLLIQGDDEALNSYLSGMAEKDFPLIVTDAEHQPISWSGLNELDKLPDDEALEKAKEHISEWQHSGNEPIPIEISEFGLKFYFYYGDSEQIRRLRVMPLVEVVIVSILVLIGYLGFRSIKRSEERMVWVGMARETAHQLGTPLTSLYGWVELQAEKPGDTQVQIEIKKDLERLRIIADRFNRIGSQAPLKLEKLLPIIKEAVEYIDRRLPKHEGSEVKIDVEVSENIEVKVNRTLFEWVLENLLKNGVEALQGKTGNVSLKASVHRSKLTIDVVDNGCGIPRRQWRNIFRPGYTTKERGWGLGLSLTRRIIEDVHRGRIWIVSSNPESGTVIRMQIPV